MLSASAGKPSGRATDYESELYWFEPAARNYLSFGASFSRELSYASFGPFRDSPFTKFNSGEKMDLSTISKDYKNIPNYKRKLTKIYRFIKFTKCKPTLKITSPVPNYFLMGSARFWYGFYSALVGSQ